MSWNRASPGPGAKNSENWICEACNISNIAQRARCKKCGTLKSIENSVETTAKTQNQKQGPLSRDHQQPTVQNPGDWICNGCSNLNWARRDNCNICNEPRPFTNMKNKNGDSQRTGRGGGHYDLQDRSDRLAHDSSDEEYDEFGRKKNKTVGAASQKRSSSTTIQKEPSLNDRHPRFEEDKHFIKEEEGLIFPPAPISESESESDDHFAHFSSSAKIQRASSEGDHGYKKRRKIMNK